MGIGGTLDKQILDEAKEIERHLHSSGSWFGAAVTPSGEIHIADRLGPGVVALQIDAGNLDWGSWVQILGSGDTPARVDQLFFDPHEMVISGTEHTTTYFVQITRGDSGAAGFAAGRYTEFVYAAGTVKFTGILSVQTGRAPTGSKLWARCLAIGQNTSTMDFFFGLHEYEE